MTQLIVEGERVHGRMRWKRGSTGSVFRWNGEHWEYQPENDSQWFSNGRNGPGVAGGNFRRLPDAPRSAEDVRLIVCPRTKRADIRTDTAIYGPLRRRWFIPGVSYSNYRFSDEKSARLAMSDAIAQWLQSPPALPPPTTDFYIVDNDDTVRLQAELDSTKKDLEWWRNKAVEEEQNRNRLAQAVTIAHNARVTAESDRDSLHELLKLAEEKIARVTEVVSGSGASIYLFLDNQMLYRVTDEEVWCQRPGQKFWAKSHLTLAEWNAHRSDPTRTIPVAA